MNNDFLAQTPYKKKLCNNFLKGNCPAGSDCTFAHGLRELRSFENQIYKSQLCTAFEQGGICQMGNDCLLAHGETEIRTDDIMPSIAEHHDTLKEPMSSRLVGNTSSKNVPEIKKGTYKTALCIHFMKHGSCHLASSCTFAHGKEELTNVSSPDPNDPKYKTKLCLRYEQDEFCPNGEFCVFAHGEAELKVQGNLGGKNKALYKTSLCHNYSSLGVCPSGKNCSFAHGRFELRPVGFDGDFDAKIAENPKWKCVQCKIYLQAGHCNRINCDYAHGEEELRVENPDAPKVIRGNYKTVLCNNFMSRGYCYHEDSCTFAHGEPELTAGKDATTALKLIRETNALRKRPKNEMAHSTAGMAGAMAAAAAAQYAPNPFMAVAGYPDQKLFAEFMEFKKIKQQTDAAGGVSPYYSGNTAAMRPPAGIPAMPGAYEPLKVMNNATGHAIPVSELISQTTGSYYHAGGYRNDDISRGQGGGKREPLRQRNVPMNGNNGGRYERQRMYNSRAGGHQDYNY